jgi:DedD protein
MDFVLKQRLVGAVVLVALGVIFIPMLLEGPDDTLVPELETLPDVVDPGPGEPLETFPTADTIPLEPGTSVIAAETAPEPLGAGEKLPEADAAPQSSEETAPDLPGSAPVQPPAKKPQPEPRPEAAAAPASPASGKPTASPPAAEPPAPEQHKDAALGSWVVQLASFSSHESAMALRDKARDKGFTAQVEKVSIKQKIFYRVRVGPFLARTEAEQTQKRLAGDLNVEGRVMSFP